WVDRGHADRAHLRSGARSANHAHGAATRTGVPGRTAGRHSCHACAPVWNYDGRSPGDIGVVAAGNPAGAAVGTVSLAAIYIGCAWRGFAVREDVSLRPATPDVRECLRE